MPRTWLDAFFVLSGFAVIFLGTLILLSTDVRDTKELYNIPLGLLVCLAGSVIVSVRVR